MGQLRKTLPPHASGVRVEGVVYGSVAGVQTPPERLWALVLTLQPWRRLGEGLCADPLHVSVPVSRAALDRLRERILPHSIVRFAIERFQPRAPMDTTWHATGRLPIRGTPGDAALHQAIARLLRPVVLQDERLGELTLNRSVDVYEGRRTVRGETWELAVQVPNPGRDPAEDSRAMIQVRQVVARLERRISAARDAIADQLLDTYNECWRDGDVISRADFRKRPRLESMVIHVGGAATLYFGDDDLFSGHSIEVRVAADGTFGQVGIAG